MSRFGLPPALLLLLIPIQIRGDDLSADLPHRFQEANRQYQQGEFAAAESAYRKLAEEGVLSGSLYYNLGNACFKQKKVGEAIFYWETARRLLPRDQDVRENLELANLMVVDRIEVPPDPLPVSFLDRAVHFLTLQQESWVVLILFVAANLLVTFNLLSRSPRVAAWARAGSLAVFALLVLSGSSLAWKIYESRYRKEGIVVEQKADLRSGPGAENVTIVTVHEGIKVRIRSQLTDWYQVSLPNGWTGWVEKEAVRQLAYR